MPANRQTNGPTNHVAEQSATGAELSGEVKNKGGDCIALQAIALPTAVAALPVARRLSRRQLASLKECLGEKDFQILNTIQRYRFVSSGQIKRLYFVDSSTDAANLRATNRALKKLREHGLIAPLTRRIGGVRAGSSALIWHLTEPGERLLHLDHTERHRKRFEEPSNTFLTHTLAVTEFAVQLIAMTRDTDGCEIRQLDPEPDCWRTYHSQGKTVYLKPDLYVVLKGEQYEDYYYIEIDLGTEPMTKLLKKCQIYCDHYRSGEDQRQIGIAPLVAWIMPDEARKNTLMRKITEQFHNEANLFRVYSATENIPRRLCDALE